MLEGIDILNKTMTTDTCGWAFVIMAICCLFNYGFLFVPQNLKKQLYPGPK